MSKVENDIRINLKNTILGGMNGIARYSFDTFFEYFQVMMKGWKPEDFEIPYINPNQTALFENSNSFLQLLQRNDFVGALKFLQGKNIFNQINNDCVNNKINVLFNVQNNTSIIDNSCNNINIINNIIQNPKVEEKKKLPEKPLPVKKELKLRKKTINIDDVNDEKIVKIDKNFILSDSSSSESPESSIEKESEAISSDKLLNKKHHRSGKTLDVAEKSSIADDTKSKKKSKKDDSSDSLYEEVIKSSQIIQSTNNQSRKRLAMEDHELAMIKRIDNPKKKKNKSEILEKNQLKIDLQVYESQFENDLNTTLTHDKHIFMKNHFPIMYNIENYYLYIKVVGDKRCTKKQEIVAKIDEGKAEYEKINKVWDPRRLNTGIGIY